jgi:hypothetical protein
MRFEGNASGWSRPFIFELKNAYLVASTSNGTLHERPDGLPRIDVHVYSDAFGEGLCQPFYDRTIGHSGLPPGIYCRLLLVGYFEGVDSERGIAWRAPDSLAIPLSPHRLGRSGPRPYQGQSPWLFTAR